MRPAEYPREPVPEKDRAVVPLYHVDVPESAQVTSTRSENLDADSGGKFRFQHTNGRTYVRLFFLDKAQAEKFGKPQQQYWATKFQSHSTYFVWNPKAEGEMPVAIKFRLVPGLSVPTNDYVEEKLGSDRGSVMPERFEVSAKSGEHEAKYVVRSLALVEAARQRGNVLYPLHGFLGSPDGVPDAAKLKGMKPNEWLEKEYLPELARFLARQGMKYGFHIEAHTQNLLVEIDPKTGAIVRFAFRDLQDVLVDPGNAALRGRLPGTERLSKHPDYQEVNRSFGTESADHSHLGRHFEAYGSQAVLEIGHKTVREKAAALFLDAYIKEVEALTGIKIVLPDAASRQLEDFRDGDSQVLTRKGMGLVMQAIHDAARGALAARRWPRPKGALEHAGMRPVVESLFREQRVALLFPDSKAKIEGYLKRVKGSPALEMWVDKELGGIVIYDPVAKAVIGFAYDLPPETRKAVGVPVRVFAECQLEGLLAP